MDDFYNGVKKALTDLEALKNKCIFMPLGLGNGYENAIEKAIKYIKEQYGV